MPSKSNGCSQAPYIPVPQKPGPREHYLTREEAQKLLERSVDATREALHVLALSKQLVRASALLELTWDRVDVDVRRIDLRDPNRPTHAKGPCQGADQRQPVGSSYRGEERSNFPHTSLSGVASA